MAQYARPSGDLDDGLWVDTYGGDSDGILYEEIDEITPGDSDYITNDGVLSTCKIYLSAVSEPGVRTGHIMRFRTRCTVATALTVYLYQGTSTFIASYYWSSLPASFETKTYTLTEAQANNITDYGDLRVWFSGPLVSSQLDVSWFEFEVPDSFTVDQEGFRWRDDDADEDEATWLAVQDTNITRAKNTNTRIRVLMNVAANPPTQTAGLWYRKVGDPDSEWRKVPLP
jgi:hypothetical protein